MIFKINTWPKKTKKKVIEFIQWNIGQGASFYKPQLKQIKVPPDKSKQTQCSNLIKYLSNCLFEPADLEAAIIGTRLREHTANKTKMIYIDDSEPEGGKSLKSNVKKSTFQKPPTRQSRTKAKRTMKYHFRYKNY